ncbi:hypothetical protein HHI36_013676 [Cryptolaemus montrouzieri]|uniref:Regulatory protein zeste n=1 Tax=Cryptolaemus montrouzieri TaxID=559131 RepID=A0ABD2NIW4_9CUCU
MAWEKVVMEFNARNSNVTREIPALKNAFTNYKTKARKSRCNSNNPDLYLIPKDNVLQDIHSVALPPEPIPPPPKSTPEPVQVPYNSSGPSDPY